jgi:TonB family protein
MQAFKIPIFAFAFICVFLGGCVPPVVLTTLKEPVNAEAAVDRSYFYIIEEHEPRPANPKVIGSVKVTDHGSSIHCTYPEVLALAKAATMKAGGNAIKIQSHKVPDWYSTCHRIEAEMLLLISPPDQAPAKLPIPDLAKIKERKKSEYDSMVTAASEGAGFIFIEQQPQFPGGQQALMDYLRSAVRYPATAVRDNVTGMVVGSFVVSENGEISDVKIIKSVRDDIDQEFIRIIRAMPNWVPGFQNGKAVKVRYNIPMRFWFENKKRKKGE